jgi:hypothetical protein
VNEYVILSESVGRGLSFKDNVQLQLSELILTELQQTPEAFEETELFIPSFANHLEVSLL